jgi:Tol biopolymer transport system component
MKFILTTLTIFISIQAIGQGDKIKGDISPIFDLAPNGDRIVVSASEGESSVLYEYSIKDKSIRQLTDNKKEYYSRPVYSPKGDKIIFLSKSLQNEQSDICLLDIAHKTITKITKGETYVTEAAFSPTGDKIIYCGANYLGSYSPTARKGPHDLDIYSIKVDGTEHKKNTSLNAYELSSISLSITGDSILCKLTKKEFEGIYLLSLTDATLIQKIEATNNPRPEIGGYFYSNPMFASDSKRISFTAPYQLYTLNLDNKECQEVWSTFGKDDQAMVIFSRFFKTRDKLIFSILRIENRQYTRNAELLTVDLSTMKATEIKLR